MVVGSKPTAGIVKLDAINAASSFHSKKFIHSFYRRGAGAARGAHNPEVTRSKRVAGIVKLDAINAASSFQTTSMADVLSSDIYFTDIRVGPKVGWLSSLLIKRTV